MSLEREESSGSGDGRAHGRGRGTGRATGRARAEMEGAKGRAIKKERRSISSGFDADDGEFWEFSVQFFLNTGR